MRPFIRNISLTFVLAFVLDYAWEHAQAILYVDYKGEPITNAVLLHATLADALFISLIALPFFAWKPMRRYAWLIVPVGVALATAIEIWALHTGRWAYAASMPIVPLLHIGLTPFLQLGVLGYVSYVIADYLGKRSVSKSEL